MARPRPPLVAYPSSPSQTALVAPPWAFEDPKYCVDCCCVVSPCGGGRRPVVWARPVRIRNDPGASELAWGWAHTRTSLGMCWSRYVLLGPGSSFASGPSGMAEMPNRGSFQGCAAKHRVWLVSTRDGFRALPASLETRGGRCTANSYPCRMARQPPPTPSQSRRGAPKARHERQSSRPAEAASW